jgi:Tfp pilus assembly protein PilN
MRAVNLLPRDEQHARFEGKRTPLLVACGGVTVVTVLLVAVGVSASGSAGEKRAQLQGIESSIATLPQPAESGLSSGLISQERTDRVAALAAALSTQISFDRLFRQISLVLPEDAWLTGLNAAATGSVAAGTSTTPGTITPPASAGTDGVTILGATYSQESVARVLSRLSVVPTLQSVRLTSSALAEPESSSQAPGQQSAPAAKSGKKVVTFTITASVRTGAAS